MTCIAAIAEGGVVWIGGDSAGIAGLDMSVRSDAKVFCNGPFVMGFTSSFRMGQLLRYAFVPPSHPEAMSIEKYMTTIFVNEVRACLKAGGWARKDNEQEAGGHFLVGYMGRIFHIESDFQVGETIDGVAAIGSGAAVALGALHVLKSMSAVPVPDRVLAALEAAERWNAGVRAPFIVKHSPCAEVTADERTGST